MSQSYFHYPIIHIITDKKETKTPPRKRSFSVGCNFFQDNMFIDETIMDIKLFSDFYSQRHISLDLFSICELPLLRKSRFFGSYTFEFLTDYQSSRTNERIRSIFCAVSGASNAGESTY